MKNSPCTWCNDTSSKIDSIEHENEQLEQQNKAFRYRLKVEMLQFQQIRLYEGTDGKVACICADHEEAIKQLLG